MSACSVLSGSPVWRAVATGLVVMFLRGCVPPAGHAIEPAQHDAVRQRVPWIHQQGCPAAARMWLVCFRARLVAQPERSVNQHEHSGHQPERLIQQQSLLVLQQRPCAWRIGG